MIRIFKLVALLVVSQVALAQAPSNYTNINGRYRWIAGMFDSTFHIPKGSTPSLRTGGSTNSGGLFYRTSDSSVYTYTGTQWIKLRGSINPSDTTNKYVTQVYKKSGSDSIFYVKGGVHTWAFNDSTGSPGGGGGGKVYYFNGGVSMGTFGGFAMYELGDTANTGAAANFTRSTTGNIANFITDPGKPGLLQIPAGVWSVDAWLSETGGGANHAEIWVEVEKWDGSTITTIATSPIEQITEGATPNLYSWSVSIPTTSLTVTDRIIIQFYISNTNGKTVTLYTQNGYVGEVHTTFTTGIGAINGLTAPAQYLVTGTSGTDFNINSSTATHTFNLPTASATNRGALSTTDWSTFNNKIGGSLVSGYLTKATGTNTIDTSQIYQSSGRIGVSTISPQTRLMVAETASDGALGILGNASNVGTFKFYANNGSTIQSVVNSSSSAMQIGTFVNSEMNLITNSATRVSILNNGNVGIGSGAATDSMLTVENGARFKRGVRMSALPTGVGTKAVRIDANGTLSVADTLANGISGTGTTNYIPKFTSSSAIGNSIMQESGSVIDIAGSLRLSATGYLGFGGGTNYIEGDNPNNILKFATNNSERMRLDASGNLGINTSSPTAKLDVNGGINMNGTMTIQSSGVTRGYFGDVDGDNNIQLRSQAALTFKTGGNNLRATLDASGNLGLGVSPAAGWGNDASNRAIQLNGGSIWGYSTSQMNILQNAIFDGANLIYVNSAAATAYRQISGVHSWYYAPSGTAGNAISFTQAMTLDASGRLGIGTTSISNKLDIYGTGGTIAQVKDGSTYAGVVIDAHSSSTPFTRWSSSGTGKFEVGYFSNQFYFNNNTGVNNTNAAMVITSTNNIGIGTSSPTSLFTVAATGSDPVLISNSGASSYNSLILQNNNNYKIAIGIGGGSVGGNLQDNGYIGTISNRDLIFNTNNTERMRITSGGELLINTTSDAGDYKLQVNGSEYISSYLYVGTSVRLSTSNSTFKATTHSDWGMQIDSPWGTGTQNYGLYISYSNASPNNTANQFIYCADNSDMRFEVQSNGNIVNKGSIKTAAPSGGTAKPWKFGEAGVSVGGANTTAVKVEIDGVVYYLLTAYLPEPAPESAPKPKPEG